MVAAADDMTPALRASGIVSTQEAAGILGCSVHYLRNKVTKPHTRCACGGQGVRPVKIGRSVFWRRSDIEAYKMLHPRVGTNRKTA